MSDLIALSRVSKDYLSGPEVVHALVDVDLRIGSGEFVAVVGSSGSGKSTLMNILGCLDRPTRGVYELAGIDVTKRSTDERALVRNRLIGFVFQGFNLLARTTALENVELPLIYRGVGARDRFRRAARSAGSSRAGRPGRATPRRSFPADSSSESPSRERWSRARRSCSPTSPPATSTRRPATRCSDCCSASVTSDGITVVIVTHEPDIAACAKRVITVRDGRIQSDEPTHRSTRSFAPVSEPAP